MSAPLNGKALWAFRQIDPFPDLQQRMGFNPKTPSGFTVIQSFLPQCLNNFRFKFRAVSLVWYSLWHFLTPFLILSLLSIYWGAVHSPYFVSCGAGLAVRRKGAAAVSGKWVRASARKKAFGSRSRQAKCSACPTRGWVKSSPHHCRLLSALRGDVVWFLLLFFSSLAKRLGGGTCPE